MLASLKSGPLLGHPSEHLSHSHFIRISFNINNHNLMVIIGGNGDHNGVNRGSGSSRLQRAGNRLGGLSGGVGSGLREASDVTL